MFSTYSSELFLICCCQANSFECTDKDLHDNLLEAAGDHHPVVKTVPPAPIPPVVPMRSYKKLL